MRQRNVPDKMRLALISVFFHSPSFVDYIVVGSDSGRIVILEYQPSKNMFEKIHQETFGKSGCRRIVPGQFLAVDPKGRAVMIGMELNATHPNPIIDFFLTYYFYDQSLHFSLVVDRLGFFSGPCQY